MKKLQHLCLTGAFTLLLTTSVFAGDIATGGRSDPPPPPPPPPIESEFTGYIDPGTPCEAIDTVADVAVGLFQAMLSVF